MNISIRRFAEQDIQCKVRWVNDERNNKYLHYDLPLSEDGTLEWFMSIKDRTDRADFTIICEGEPAGVIGLLNIDSKNRKAEYYILVGEDKFRGKGVAYQASKQLLRFAYETLKLNKIYLYTEVENKPAQRLFEKLGFVIEGLLKEDLIYNGRKIDRYIYGLTLDNYHVGEI